MLTVTASVLDGASLILGQDVEAVASCFGIKNFDRVKVSG